MQALSAKDKQHGTYKQAAEQVIAILFKPGLMLVELVLGPLALLAFLLDVSGSLLVLAHFKKGSQMDEPIEPSLAASGPPLATSCWSTTGAGLHGACDWQQNSKKQSTKC